MQHTASNGEAKGHKKGREGLPLLTIIQIGTFVNLPNEFAVLPHNMHDNNQANNTERQTGYSECHRFYFEMMNNRFHRYGLISGVTATNCPS